MGDVIRVKWRPFGRDEHQAMRILHPFLILPFLMELECGQQYVRDRDGANAALGFRRAEDQPPGLVR